VCGEIFVLDIGFPQKLVEEEAQTFSLFQMDEAARLLPVRAAVSHKANHGRVLIIAGSTGKWGAALLCARSASCSGAGFVYVASHEMPNEVLRESPEFLVSTLEDIKDFSVFDAVVIGPGLGVGTKTLEVLERLSATKNLPVLVDADGLTTLAQSQFEIPNHWVLTPHMGEFSRFLEISVDEIEFNRWKALELFRKNCQSIVVLKGFHSQVSSCFEKPKIRIVDSGNSALAKAGSGDVLSGLIGGLIAQGLHSEDAAALGCYIHGRAADLYIRDRGHPATLLISELFHEIPRVFSELDAAKALR
jgi:NAD(P)H-hydrate epimerase